MKTIISTVEVSQTIQKSEFISYLIPVKNEDEAKEELQNIKKQHPKATHHCSAMVIDGITRSNDDGEPASTSGLPMLQTLLGNEMDYVLAVVVRYYGGILLGTGGLVRAYGNGVQQALKLLETERKVERQLFQVHCDYAQLNWIQILCEQHQIEIYQQDFQVQITLQLGISEDQIKPFEQALIERSAGTLKLEEMN